MQPRIGTLLNNTLQRARGRTPSWKRTLPRSALAFFVFFYCPAAHADQVVGANDPIALSGPAGATPTAAPPEDVSPAARPAFTPAAITIGPARLTSVPPANTRLAKKTETGATSAAPLESQTPKPAGHITTSVHEDKPLGRVDSPRRLGPAAESKGSADGAPLGGGMISAAGEFTRVLGALAVVIGLVMVIRAVLRRAGNAGLSVARPSGVVEVLARFPLPGGIGSRRQELIIFKFARRIILAHQCGTGMTMLSEMSDPDEVAALLARMEAGSSGRDAERFKSALEQFGAEYQNSFTQPLDTQTTVADTETEVVDLTRVRGNGLARFLRLPLEVAR
jgi:flagellar biogenesis protein FliO